MDKLINFGQGRTEPDNMNQGLTIKMNHDGIIRDDRLNIIGLELINNELAGDQKPCFEKTFLDEQNILEKIYEILLHSLENRVYIFFSIKPVIGTFKSGLKSEEMVQVQSAVKESSTKIILKVNFRSALRPCSSFLTDYQKKKNLMSLDVILFYKKNLTDSQYTYVAGIDSFRFRNNSTKPYIISNKKRKLIQSEDPDYDILEIPNTIDELVTDSYPSAISNPINVSENLNPSISRIHPDQCPAYQNWDYDNPDITFIVLGINLRKMDGIIKVYFEYNGKSVEATEKLTEFGEKEYYVPCVKRIIQNPEIGFPEKGLIVDVVFRVDNKLLSTQKYTYLNVRWTAQTAFFGTTERQTLSRSDPTSEKSSSLFFFPDRCDESEVIRYYENNQSIINFDMVDQFKRNIVHYAVQLDFKDLTDYVIHCGANVDQQDINQFTPLHMAVYYNNLSIVEILLKNNASLRIVDVNGNNPYKLAVQLRRYEIITYILKKTFIKCRVVKDRISAEQMTQVSSWLRSMDGRCTVSWRLHILPYLPLVPRLICTAASIEKPKFVHFNEKSGMYSIKINHPSIMIKKLFPDGKKTESEDEGLNKSWSGRKQGIPSDNPNNDNVINVHNLSLSEPRIGNIREDSDEKEAGDDSKHNSLEESQEKNQKEIERKKQ